MTYFCAYDISNNRVRYRVNRYLERIARRYQKSVFIFEADKEHVRQLTDFALNVLGSDDLFIIVPVCSSCIKGSSFIGDDPLLVHKDFVIL